VCGPGWGLAADKSSERPKRWSDGGVPQGYEGGVCVSLCVSHHFNDDRRVSSDRATSESPALTSTPYLASHADGEQQPVEINTRIDDEEEGFTGVGGDARVACETGIG
jgi:hypothetical protein